MRKKKTRKPQQGVEIGLRLAFALARAPGPMALRELTAESLPGFEAAGWYGFFAPAGTPRPVLEKLNAQIVKAVSSPELSARIENLGLVPAPQSLDEAPRFVAAEAVKWTRAVNASGASAD